MSNAQFYSHSGKFEPRNAALSIAIGFAVMILLSACYAWALVYSPFVLLNVLALLIFAGCVGAIFGYSAKHYHIRNERLVLCVGGLLAVLAVYFQWAFYVAINSEFSSLELLVAPVRIWDGMVYFDANPLKLVFDMEPTGIIGWIIWGLEAITIAGVSWFATIAMAGQSDNIYCETCELWIDNDSYTGLLEGDVAVVAQAKETGDLAPIVQLSETSAPRAGATYLELKLDSCPVCEQLNVVDIFSVECYENKDGELKTTTILLLDNLLIDRDIADQLRCDHAMNDDLFIAKTPASLELE